MARPKGSKNKKEEIDAVIHVDEDLLSTDVVVTDEIVAQIVPTKEKTLLGYHPITGVEIWT
jgi:adenosyl cobinamide kinase/adenosyl cobinamide phosphate guanylyltransferase